MKKWGKNLDYFIFINLPYTHLYIERIQNNIGAPNMQNNFLKYEIIIIIKKASSCTSHKKNSVFTSLFKKNSAYHILLWTDFNKNFYEY